MSTLHSFARREYISLREGEGEREALCHEAPVGWVEEKSVVNK